MSAPAITSAVNARDERAARSVPGSRLGVWIGVGALLALSLPRGMSSLFLALYNAGLLGLFLWDRTRLKHAALRFTRAPALRLFAHQTRDYTLRAALAHGPRLRLIIEESAPPGFEITPVRQWADLQRDSETALSAELHATRHGVARLTQLSARRESALGLCAIVETHPCPGELRAYPRLPLRDASLPPLVLTRPGSVPRPRQSVGQSGEIERLREYQSTDPMRSIDWKATAKRARPITRAYQAEQSQTLWLVLDASRCMMAASDHGAPHTRFEAALEAALALAAAALEQGDQVGLIVYGRALKLSLKARRGRAQLFALVEALLTVQPESSELDAAGLLATFSRLAPKRSLFVFFTDFENEADLHELARHAPLLTRRHLALCVSLRRQDQERCLSAPIAGERDAYRRLAALHLQGERDRLKQDLRARGLYVIESQRAELPQATVAEYRRQKRAGRL